MKSYLLLFLIWPFGSLIESLRHFRSREAKIIFWLFCIFFGFTFVFPESTVGAADSSRYAVKLLYMHQHALEFGTLIKQIYNSSGTYTDIYDPLMTWFVALFTANPHILYALFAAIFGYFYAQNLWMIFDKINTKVGFVLFLFILLFALINPIWNINGVRMYTAAQIFLYGTLRFFLNNDKKGVFWAAGSILVHFSFLFPVLLLFVYLWLPKHVTLYFILFILTSFIHELDIQAIRHYIIFLPESFQHKMFGYTNEAVILARKEAATPYSWHVQWAHIFSRWITYILVIAAYVWRKHWINDNLYTKKLFMYALYMGGFAQIAALLPSGGRFFTISNSLFYIVFILILSRKTENKMFFRLAYLTAPFLLFIIIFQIRVGFDYAGFMSILGNPFTLLFGNEQTPLIDFVKSLL